MNIPKITTGALALFMAFSLGACSTDNASDADEADVAEAEMDDTYASDVNYFTDWDSDGDGYLSEDEYAGGSYKNWDTNQDSRLDEDEWNRGVENDGMTGQSWADWDLDADGFINDGEYREGNTRGGWYKTWDSDGDNRLSRDEYDQRMTVRND